MIVIILLLGLIFRLFSLNQSFWLDEATTAQVARNFNLVEIVTKFSPGDFHPPLYYLILKLWSVIFGTGEIMLRTPSVIFGLLTVFVIYLIGKKLFSQKVGVIAASLLSTSGLHIYYSQEARMYSLVALLVSLLVYAFIKKSWILFSGLLVLVAATDYPALLVIPVFWIMGKRDWKKLIISHIPLLVFSIAWLPIFVKQLVSGLGVKASAPGWWTTLGKTNLKELILIPTKFILGRISFEDKNIYALVVFVVFALFGYLLLTSRKKSKLTWLWLTVPVALAMVLGFKVSIFSYFRLLFVLPAFYLLVALGISRIKGYGWKLALILTLLVNLLSASAYLLNSKFHRENWRDLVDFVENQKTENSITLFVADSNMEAYLYYSPDAKIAGPSALSTDYDQIWLMRYVKDIFDPEDSLKLGIEKLKYSKVGEYNFNGVGVWKYERS